jgi:phosphoglycolate phosphatase
MKNILPEKLQAVFLDFDGVVVESTTIKTEAFYEIYLSYGREIAEKAKEFHLAHQGITRAIKFREIHWQFLRKRCEIDEQNRLSERFAEIVFAKILECPMVDGIIDFLETSRAKNIPAFLLSATPQKELELICCKRGLSQFFKTMYGAPYTKTEAGESLLKQYNLNPDQAIFVGDSLSDYEAASALGISFIARVAKGMTNPFPESLPRISSFKDVVI